MDYFHSKICRPLVLFFLILLFSLLNSKSEAQITPNYGRPSQIERDMRYREWALERLRQQQKLTSAEQKLAYEQLNKDFLELQVLNNDLIKTRTSEETSDYQLIAKKTLEIHKIARRLSAMLKLPEQEESAKKQTASNNSEVNLSAVLTILDTVIYRFVKNPIFKNVEIIDVKDAINAKADLDRILFLSERAKKKAEKLSKRD